MSSSTEDETKEEHWIFEVDKWCKRVNKKGHFYIVKTCSIFLPIIGTVLDMILISNTVNVEECKYYFCYHIFSFVCYLLYLISVFTYIHLTRGEKKNVISALSEYYIIILLIFCTLYIIVLLSLLVISNIGGCEIGGISYVVPWIVILNLTFTFLFIASLIKYV